MKNTKSKRVVPRVVGRGKNRQLTDSLHRTLIHKSTSLSDLLELSEVLTLKSKGINPTTPLSPTIEPMIQEYDSLDNVAKVRVINDLNNRIISINSIQNRPSRGTRKAYVKLLSKNKTK
jgi:hypothetical protein